MLELLQDCQYLLEYSTTFISLVHSVKTCKCHKVNNPGMINNLAVIQPQCQPSLIEIFLLFILC